MIVVSDTSPVLNLARIDRLELLASLYKMVLIPTAVYAELNASEPGLLFAADLASKPWLTVAAPKDHDRVQKLCKDLLLVDERRGRRMAKDLGLTVTGLLGVLADAKKAGLLEKARPVLDELIQTARFWVGPDLYREFLVELDET